MAVSATATVLTREFRIHQKHYEMPAGFWYGQATVNGDVSGGSAAVVFNLPTTNEFLYASWEEGHAVDTRTAGAAAVVVQFNVAAAASGAAWLLQRTYEQQVVQADLPGTLMYFPGTKIIFPTVASGSSLTKTIVQFLGSNPGAAQSVTCSAWGYLWHRKAVDAAGGPRRPSGAFFGGLTKRGGIGP